MVEVHAELQKDAVMDNPVIEFSWAALDVSCIFKNQPFVKVAVKEGGFRLSLAPLRPSLLLHKGNIVATVTVSGEQNETINSIAEIVKDGVMFLPVTFEGNIGARAFSLRTVIPPFSALSSTTLNMSGERKEKDGIKSHSRLVGMKGSKYELLVDLGDRTSCHDPNTDFGSVVQVRLEAPQITTNLCIFREHENLGCMARVKTMPMVVTARIVDSEVCGVQIVSLDGAVEEEDEVVREASLTIQNANTDANKNWLPLQVNVFDYKKAFEALDAMYEDVSTPFTLAPGRHNKSSSPILALNSFINNLSRVLTYRLNFPLVSLDAQHGQIMTLPESVPMETTVDIWSDSRQHLRGELVVSIPKEASEGTTGSRCTSNTFEWGPLEMELRASNGDWFRMSLSEGRLYMAYPNDNCPPSTSKFVVHFECKSGVEHLNSGDLRRAIHHLTSHNMGKKEFTSAINIDEQRLQMTARVGQYASPAEFKPFSSALKLRTLVQLGHVAYSKYKYGKPSGLPTDWHRSPR
jgi:hypothetical protein